MRRLREKTRHHGGHRGPRGEKDFFVLLLRVHRGGDFMSTWLVEPLASPTEIDAILAIEEASFTNPWTREMYVAELQNTGVSFFFIAKDAERRAVGFCSFWRVLDEVHINNLAVLPPNRRPGVGTALLMRVVSERA